MALLPSRSSKGACAGVNNAIQVAMCLVDGCAADLSDCRKYYQRHKVCEIHAKSPQVSINGQKLRFCQQCSRFHLLEEFDEGKRSCRKRLDGHNRRRRKPRPILLPPNHGTSMLQSAGQQVQVQPTMARTDPLWSGLIEAPTWVDHSNYAPSLLSSSVAPPQASTSTQSHAVHPSSDSGSVSVTKSSLDQEIGYVGLENDCDVGWVDMTDMDPHHHASFDHEDPQTHPLDWQY